VIGDEVHLAVSRALLALDNLPDQLLNYPTRHNSMELVTVKTKFQVVISRSIRRRARVDIGDLLEASFENGRITFTPKTVIDRHLAEGMEDLAQGRIHGPYKSAAKAISALERRTGRQGKSPRKRK